MAGTDKPVQAVPAPDDVPEAITANAADSAGAPSLAPVSTLDAQPSAPVKRPSARVGAGSGEDAREGADAHANDAAAAGSDEPAPPEADGAPKAPAADSARMRAQQPRTQDQAARRAPTRRSDRPTGVRRKGQRKAPARSPQGTRRPSTAGAQRAARMEANAGGTRTMPRSLRRYLVAAAIVVVAFMAIGALDAIVNWGKIYTGVRIGSVEVSGMTVEEATAAVDAVYGKRLNAAEVNIYADEATYEKAKAGQDIEDLQESETVSSDEAAAQRKVWTTNASELQARIYPDQLAEQALKVGREDGGIGARIEAQTFGREIAPTAKMSKSAVESLARSIDRAIGEEHADCDIDLSSGVAYVVAGHDGQEVNRDMLAREISAQLLGLSEEQGIVAHAEHADMRVSEADAQAVADRINAGLAYGATFEFEGTRWEAGTYDLAVLIDTKIQQGDDGTWTIAASYDEAAAKQAILSHLSTAFSKQNIKVEFAKADDGIMVNTDASGTMPEVGKAVAALDQATLQATPAATPVVRVEGTQIPASMSIDAARDYGLISVISSYETEYTEGATNRNTNIHLAADLIDDSIVKANGGTWSFNETAGECNEEKGFKGAGTIVGGEIVDDVGGGICQVATTVFNAVFEAGLPVDERSNHSLYIASYPSGRDAAVSWPELDLRWHNDTNCDILLQTEWTDSTITVTLLGVDPGYTVESREGEFKEGAKYNVRTEVDDDLAQGETQLKTSGQDGMSIEVSRRVKDASGNILHEETFSSVYDAIDEVILVGPNTEVDLSLYDDREGSGSSASEGSEDPDGDSDDEDGYDDSFEDAGEYDMEE